MNGKTENKTLQAPERGQGSRQVQHGVMPFKLNELYCLDCMDGMRLIPDKYFDLAIVDPPYGNNDAIGISNGNGHAAERKEYKQFCNVPPPTEYFDELRRVSKNQIIWGGNWFGLKGGYLCWQKNGTAFGQCELAYCSMFNSVCLYEFTWNGMIQGDMKNKENRIHPTQKPRKLYSWLLSNYAKNCETILDTHVGSGSSIIEFELQGFEWLGFELDEDYYVAAKERLKRETAQQQLFDPKELTA
jgi:site-specific DNA-methyltransferase (adenine-specific)